MITSTTHRISGYSTREYGFRNGVFTLGGVPVQDDFMLRYRLGIGPAAKTSSVVTGESAGRDAKMGV